MNQLPNLNDLSKTVHAANIKWWQDVETGEPIERNRFELIALVISEISECLEGERKNLMDDKLPHRKMAEVEMADTYIRLLDYAGGFGVHLNRQTFAGRTPENKGEALFQIIRSVSNIPNSLTSAWINLSIAMIEAYCKKHGYDLQGAFEEKMAFNATRDDHKHEARRIAGGKQF